ncbi:MAG: hypothetical protein JSR24_07690 [Proteobacteria bacterium]|nr:hypothetical protein [Pseudomonadota bacterium]
MPKRRRRLALVSLAVAAGLGLFAWLEPALAATACPICYGFERLDDDVYIDRHATDTQRDSARAIAATARQRIRAFYGRQESDPRLFLCTTHDCYDGFGGGSRGMAILDVVLVLAPLGFNAVIATHELSHIELHRRLGRIDTMRRAIPQWFDEGVAAMVSQDPRYPPAASDTECADAAQGALPAARAAWIHDVNHDALYAKAARRVGCWMANRGGPKAVTNLIEQVAAGTRFEDAWR